MQKLDFNILVEKLSGSADLIDPFPRNPTPGNPNLGERQTKAKLDDKNTIWQ